MKKIFCFILLAVIITFSTSCQKQQNIASDDTTLGDTVADTTIFETENITRIFLCIEYGNSEKIEVPDQHMQEITAWLNTFKVGEQIKEDENVPPGTNYCYVEIEYADGTVVNT